MVKGIRKRREGLKLLIEGIIENNLELKKDKDIPQVRGVIEMQNNEIKEYIRIAEERYIIPEEELFPLKFKYASMKASLGLK